MRHARGPQSLGMPKANRMSENRSGGFLPRLCMATFWCFSILLGCRGSERSGGMVDLRPGSQLPNLLQVGRLRNAPVARPAPKSGWVLYVFSPSSPLCASNAPAVATLANSLPEDWVLLSVAMDNRDLQSFIDRFTVTTPVLTGIPETELTKYQPAASRTYLLDDSWQLIEILDGPYQGEVAERLSRRLKVQLPRVLTERAQNPEPSRKQPIRLNGELCLDSQQKPYSRGAKADVLGMRFECGTGGLWIPVV